MTVLNFAAPTSPYEGLADSLIGGYTAGTKAKEQSLSFPEQLRQLQANTKLLDTQAKYAEPLAAANLTQQQVAADYAQPNAAADLQKQQLANALSGINNKYAPRKNESDIGKTELENQAAGINLKTLPQKNAADIAETNARAGYMASGGGRGGVKTVDEQTWINTMKAYNPQLDTPEKVREADLVYAQGGTQLSDGTQLAPMVPQSALDRAFSNTVKNGTTAALVTKGVQANAGDAELKVLGEEAENGLSLAGTSYKGINPTVLSLSFAKDDASQDKLGQIIGANAIQYAIAQIRNRIDMGEPGITATHEIMSNSGQLIDSMNIPRITPRARAKAQKYIENATNKALTARNKYGISAAGAAGRGNQQGASSVSSAPVTLAPYTDKDIEDTAKANGISVDEVKLLLKRGK